MVKPSSASINSGWSNLPSVSTGMHVFNGLLCGKMYKIDGFLDHNAQHHHFCSNPSSTGRRTGSAGARRAGARAALSPCLAPPQPAAGPRRCGLARASPCSQGGALALPRPRAGGAPPALLARLPASGATWLSPGRERQLRCWPRPPARGAEPAPLRSGQGQGLG